jgi:ATP-binding cassette subfamily F protein 2
MSGELQPTLGDIRPHGHLKIGRFTQHFVDVLNLEQTPLEFFDTVYPGTPREDQRKYLGRFGISGKMQVQKMAELSDGQKSRVVFAKLGRDAPHILLLVSFRLFDVLDLKYRHANKRELSIMDYLVGMKRMSQPITW